MRTRTHGPNNSHHIFPLIVDRISVELLNTKEYSQVLIVTTFKHDDLPKVYPKYVKKQMVIFRGITTLVCQHSKSLTSQKNHIYYLWGDIEKSLKAGEFASMVL